MASQNHLRILRKGVAAWNTWRNRNQAAPNLSGADLSGADLGGADLSRAELDSASLNLAQLQNVNLEGASLNGVEFEAADLSGANLKGARLASAMFRDTDLSSTDFSGAIMWATQFSNVDLSAAKGLATVWHEGPSTIDIATIYRSRGEIPEAFLRGAGAPDDFITFIRSLVGQAIEYYSCFISHSAKDQDFAERLHADLQNKGVRCWFAPKDVQGGRKLHEQIDEAIRYHDKLLLVLSENSMRSEWVKTEIRRARREEVKAGRRKLFPISLAPFSTVQEWEAFDADFGKDMAVELREYFIPDFSCWKQHDDYQQALTRLLRDLKAETPVAAAKDE